MIFVGSTAVGKMVQSSDFVLHSDQFTMSCTYAMLCNMLQIMRNAAETLTPVTLELGGKDAFIICEDADVSHVSVLSASWCSLLFFLLFIIGKESIPLIKLTLILYNVGCTSGCKGHSSVQRAKLCGC